MVIQTSNNGRTRTVELDHKAIDSAQKHNARAEIDAAAAKQPASATLFVFIYLP